MGLSVLPHIEMIINERKRVVERYQQQIDTGILQQLKIRENTQWNYSYFPVIFPSEELLLKTIKAFNKQEIFPRRYFYPSLNKLNYVNNSSMPVSESVSERILCLPLYHFLKNQEIDQRIEILMKTVL